MSDYNWYVAQIVTGMVVTAVLIIVTYLALT